jgi:glutamine amidotransferase
MIAIIDYGLSGLNDLTDILSKLGCDFKVTTNETDLLKADKIILPDAEDLIKAFRKLNLLNINSMLYMLDKPMLGISGGIKFLPIFSIGDPDFCTGVVSHDTGTYELTKNDDIKLSDKEILIKNPQSKLITGIEDKTKFYFKNFYNLPVTGCTTSVLKDKPECAVTIEKGIYYAIQFLPEKSGKDGGKVLQNFIEATTAEGTAILFP